MSDSDLPVEPADAAGTAPQATGQSAVALAASPSSRKRCAATTPDGRPCSANPVAGQDRCFHHSTDPTTRALAQSARRQGGAVARLQGVDLDADFSGPEAIRSTLKRVSDAVAAGRIPSAAGQVVVQAARVAIDSHAAETEVQLARLMEMVEELQRGAQRV